MRLIIVRHGESEGDILNVHEGRADFLLTERGHAQAEALAEYIADKYKVDCICSSPLKRAYQTAQHISEKTGVNIIMDDDLMEFNNGLIAGLSREEADEKYPYIPDLPIDQAVYGQESKVAFRERANQVVAKLCAQRASEKTILIVSHGGMINQIFHALLELPILDGNVFITGDTGLHEWLIREDTKYLLSTNVQEHLK